VGEVGVFCFGLYLCAILVLVVDAVGIVSMDEGELVVGWVVGF